MTAAEDISEGLYLKLVDHVSNLLKALAREVDDPALASAQAEAQSKLQIIEQALTKAIKELKDNAEHKTFTVAFYGETNAGKSTLIETLRILLKETTKREQRQRFIALQQQSGLSEKTLQALEAEIETLGHRLAETKNETVAADIRAPLTGVNRSLISVGTPAKTPWLFAASSAALRAESYSRSATALSCGSTCSMR
ncbi:hypothetical protein ALP59_02170 [Pseudomonas savastanoi]|uniref:Uncharacterized protein n=1 Tax=Pseudomonas savastanoi TaxID=29438 RepID=A0A3M5FPH6_PSESS|nr:hypothetical protein ALP59_02170 [Pseudomonas savastanoi]